MINTTNANLEKEVYERGLSHYAGRDITTITDAEAESICNILFYLANEFYDCTYEEADDIYADFIRFREEVRNDPVAYDYDCMEYFITVCLENDLMSAEAGRHDNSSYYSAKVGKTLYLEKRGCNFLPGSRESVLSNVGNHRVCSPSYCINGKDGNTYFLEFGHYDKKEYITVNPKTGKKYSSPVSRLVKECSLCVNTAYTDADGCTWGNSRLAAEISSLSLDYSLDGILQAVNYISCDRYSEIIFTESFSVVVPKSRNFTPSGLIYEFGKKNGFDVFRTKYFNTVINLPFGNFEYHHYEESPVDDESVCVTVYLQEYPFSVDSL